MMIFELLTTLSFLAGLHFILTIILPVFISLAGAIYLVDRARLVVYQAGIDYLELLARRDALSDDHARRELAIAEAGLTLRIKRLELRDKIPE